MANSALASNAVNRDYANKLLRYFVTEFETIYGRNMLVYNVHNLIHLAADVEQFGPLENFAAFSFESFLGGIKKMVRSPHRPL